MTIEFKTRQEFNRFTLFASELFDSKLSNVQQKTAKKMGFKNANALVPQLSEEKIELNIDHKPSLESFPEVLLTEEIKFEHQAFNNKKTILIDYKAPRFIKMMYDGFTFKDEEWLTKKVLQLPYDNFDDSVYDYFQETHQNTICSITGFYLESEEHKKENYRYSFSIAFIQNVINGALYEEDFLLKNPDILFDLISGGSIKQFNMICNSDNIINSLNDDGLYLLSKRYFQILLLCENEHFDDFYSDADCFNDCINPRDSKTINKEDAMNILKELAVPPVKVFLNDKIERELYDGSVIAQFLEYHFPLCGSNIGDSVFSDLIELEDITSKKTKTLTDIEIAFFKHASLAVNILLRRIIEDTAKSYAMLDLSMALRWIKYLNLNQEDLNSVLTSIPSGKIVNYVSSFDETYNSFNTNYASWVVMQQMNLYKPDEEEINDSKIFVQSLFSHYNDEILESKLNCFNDSNYECEDLFDTLGKSKKELAEYQTLKELMVYFLKN